MNAVARQDCESAVRYITKGDYEMALQCLRLALKNIHNRRAWSKIMLAIRELSRIAPAPSVQ